MNSDDQTKLSIEELMEIAKHPLKKDPASELAPVKRFIVSAGLKDGDNRIPAAVIWDRYLTWATENNIKIVSLIAFFKEFAKYYNRITTKYGRVYLLSHDGFDLSDENLQRVNLTHVAKRISNGKKKKNPRKKIKKDKPGLTEAPETDESET